MRQFTAREMAAFDINALSQEERTAFYRHAIRSAHAARSEAMRGMFAAIAKRLERHPLLTRALIDSAVVLAMVIALGLTAFEPAIRPHGERCDRAYQFRSAAALVIAARAIRA